METDKTSKRMFLVAAGVGLALTMVVIGIATSYRKIEEGYFGIKICDNQISDQTLPAGQHFTMCKVVPVLAHGDVGLTITDAPFEMRIHYVLDSTRAPALLRKHPGLLNNGAGAIGSILFQMLLEVTSAEFSVLEKMTDWHLMTIYSGMNEGAKVEFKTHVGLLLKKRLDELAPGLLTDFSFDVLKLSGR